MNPDRKVYNWEIIMTIEFTSPELTELTPKITVFGVGGAGGNAVNNMLNSSLTGVDFVCANTDAQALSHSLAEKKIQLGAQLTQGLGAGARPEVGKAAAEETMDLIEEHLDGCHMIFITAGMGGGTGTGAAPMIAKKAREKGILTVGVVTKPFQFEGGRRMKLAEEGIAELTKYVDTLIIIPNQNLFRIANERTTFADAFAMADEVLHSGVRGITDLMMLPGLVNLDFADLRTVMSEMGKAMMGTGEAEGDNRALEAAEAAISNPLLDEVSMKGARGVLINITGGMDLTLFEVDEAANRIRSEVDPEANILVGSALDSSLNGKMRVSVVATGIEGDLLASSEIPVKTYTGYNKSQEGKTPVDMNENSHENEKTTILNEDDIIEENSLNEETVGEDEIEDRVENPDVEVDKEAPFIAPESMMPEESIEDSINAITGASDPYAEAALMNTVPNEKPRQKLGLFQSFLGGGKKEKRIPKEPTLKQGDMLNVDESKIKIIDHTADNNEGTVKIVEHSSADVQSNSKPLIIAKEDLDKNKDVREDHLEIPAFLRRQAN
jgi:cell division protein FtsZ